MQVKFSVYFNRRFRNSVSSRLNTGFEYSPLALTPATVPVINKCSACAGFPHLSVHYKWKKKKNSGFGQEDPRELLVHHFVASDLVINVFIVCV